MSNNLYALTMSEIYDLVLSRKLKRFPNYTWSEQDGYQNAISCTKHLIENILKWNEDDIKKKLSLNVFREYKLSGMMSILFGNSPFSALNLAYPDKFKPWEMKVSPLNTWDVQTGIEAFKWLIEDKLKWTEDDIRQKLSLKVIIDGGLGGMMETLVNNSPYEILNLAYPNKFKPWEITAVPTNTWNDDTKVAALKWLLDEKLKWSQRDIEEKLNMQTLVGNGFSSLVQDSTGKESRVGYIENIFKKAYPDIPLENVKLFRDVEKRVQRRDREYAKKEIREVIIRTIGEDYESIKKHVNFKFLMDNKLSTVMQNHYNNSPYEAINDIYPNKFKPWEIGSNVSKGFWTNDKIKEAVRWLVEEKLKIEPRMSYLLLTIDIFQENDIGGLLSFVKVSEAIKLTYPDLEPFSTIEIYELLVNGDIDKYPVEFWNHDNAATKAVEILKYIIEEKLKWKEQDIYENYSFNFLIEHKLKVAFKYLKYTSHELLELAYPNKFKPWLLKTIPSSYWNEETIIKAITETLIENKVPKNEWKSTINTKWLKENNLAKVMRFAKIEDIKLYIPVTII